jgi:hypothetical protein
MEYLKTDPVLQKRNVSHRGKTKVYKRDKFRRNHSVVAILNNVLTSLGSHDGSSPSSSGTPAADTFRFCRTGSVSRYSMKTETSTSIDFAPLYGVTGTTLLHSAITSKTVSRKSPSPYYIADSYTARFPPYQVSTKCSMRTSLSPTKSHLF